ncbi:MAG: radical SAM protein [Candidatus Omnitrophota bacterium]
MKYSEIINVGTRMVFARIMKHRVPFQISIRVTEQCNQHCSYCIGDFTRGGTYPPTTKQLLDLIDGFAQLGTKHITLLGGEPLLRNDINEIVCRVKEYKINCSITTNGRLIGKSRNILTKIDLLSISLDGDAPTHDAYRGEGSHSAAITALNIAKEIGVPVQIICTVTNLTDIKLKYLTEIAEKYACMITFELLNPIFNQDGTITLRAEDIGENKAKELLDFHLKNKNKRIQVSSSVLKYVGDWPFSYNTFRMFKKFIPIGFNPVHCYAGYFSGFIEANGDLTPCCLIRNDYNPVNVFELGVKEAWKQMPVNNCATCRSIGCNMFNTLFEMQPDTIHNFLRILFKRKSWGDVIKCMNQKISR